MKGEVKARDLSTSFNSPPLFHVFQPRPLSLHTPGTKRGVVVGICWVIAEEEGSTTWDTLLPTLRDQFSSSTKSRKIKKAASAPGKLYFSRVCGPNRGVPARMINPTVYRLFPGASARSPSPPCCVSVCIGRMGSSRKFPGQGPSLLRGVSAQPTATPAGSAESLHCS